MTIGNGGEQSGDRGLIVRPLSLQQIVQEWNGERCSCVNISLMPNGLQQQLASEVSVIDVVGDQSTKKSGYIGRRTIGVGDGRSVDLAEILQGHRIADRSGRLVKADQIVRR